LQNNNVISDNLYPLRYICIILFFYCFLALAIEDSPKFLRACINNDDSTVTLSWKPPNDICGSFTKYAIFGSKNNGPFELLDNIFDLSIIEYPHKLVDQNTTWKYYIATHTLCNRVNSAISDTLAIDLAYPIDIQIDSVSYDLNTQDIIAGWKQNPSIDTKNYEIFNFISGNGDSIGSTISTNYIVSKHPASRFPTAIATIDSCKLSSLISKTHRVVYIQPSIDTCLNQISLNWNLYQGWGSIDSQTLFVSKNHQPFTRGISLGSTSKSLVYNDFVLGDTVEFYIRSYFGDITSSSNKTKLETRKLTIPDYLYLNYVTVNNNTVELKWSGSKLGDTKSFNIYKSENNNTLTFLKSEIKQINVAEYYHIDTKTSVNENIYHYKIEATNKCDEPTLSTETSESLLLKLKPQSLHNTYLGWENGTNGYELQKQVQHSTWNTISKDPDGFYNSDFSDSSGCFRIKALESTNSYTTSATSISNVVCILDSLQVYVTTALNPYTSNNRFVITGKGINHSKSTYQIFNRWGELMILNNTNSPWYGKYKDQHVTAGVYIYIINLYGLNGEKQTEKGIINVLK